MVTFSPYFSQRHSRHRVNRLMQQMEIVIYGADDSTLEVFPGLAKQYVKLKQGAQYITPHGYGEQDKRF